MPTSVLLAILAGAGLLALAPALVRRYDSDERLAIERDESSARVLERGPGGERSASDDDGEDGDAVDDDTSPRDTASPSWERCGVDQAKSVLSKSSERPEERRRMTAADARSETSQAELRSWWRRRHRRVLFVLIGMTALELVGVIVVGPGFWIGFAVSLGLLLAFVRYLRLRVVRSTQRPRRPAVASERQVYVPAQTERASAAAVTAEPEDEPDESEQVAAAEPTAPSRRRTGGIRGRSYESPANL